MGGRGKGNLKRRSSRREPKRRFILYCEGRNTEPAYFDAIRRIYSDALISVETVPAAGVPYTIAGLAVERARSLGLTPNSRKPRDSFEEKDEVWAVFDRDEHPRYEEAVATCHDSNVGVARSNPCFEVWLILREQNYERPDDRHAVQLHLQGLRPEYGRGNGKTPDCVDLVQRVEEAEQRAEVQLDRRNDEGDPFGRPSTTVGRLTTAIRKAAGDAQPK